MYEPMPLYLTLEEPPPEWLEYVEKQAQEARDKEQREREDSSVIVIEM